MAFKIELQSTILPVQINDQTFQVDASDAQLRRFSEQYKLLLKEAEQMKTGLLENEDGYRKFVETSMDTLLGAGAFEQLYATCPSVIILFNALNQVADHLMKNLLEPRRPAQTPALGLAPKPTKRWLGGKK